MELMLLLLLLLLMMLMCAGMQRFSVFFAAGHLTSFDDHMLLL